MEPRVATTHGAIEGTSAGDILAFRGIPFARPPVGARRWRRPEPPEPWTGVRPAKDFGPACPQEWAAAGGHNLRRRADRQDEDCLHLNVWTPGLDDAARPTMVWVHGGAFGIGASSWPMYDGRRLASRGVVVVTVNYRLGPFGFLRLAEATDGAVPATGNEGLLDVVAALWWVRENVARFGGDPENVTVFGQSAGAMVVSALLTMPAASGLFHKAIAQSGVAVGALDVEHAGALARDVLDALGLDCATELLAVGADKLSAAAPGFVRPAPGSPHRYPRPVVDGDVLPQPVLDAVAVGASMSVPLLVGTTRDELTVALPPGATLSSLPEAMAGFVAGRFDVATLVGAYEAARRARWAPSGAAEVAAAIATDYSFRIPAARLLDGHGARSPAYNYLFAWDSPSADGTRGAMHGIDVGFVFGTHAVDDDHASVFGAGPAADALTDAVAEAWVAFAQSGDPSTDALGPWPPYGGRRSTMVLGERTHLVDAPFEAERQAWEHLPDAAFSLPGFSPDVGPLRRKDR